MIINVPNVSFKETARGGIFKTEALLRVSEIFDFTWISPINNSNWKKAFRCTL